MKLRENQVLVQRVWLAEMNKQKLTLLCTFWSQLEVEVSNIYKRAPLSDISDVSEASRLMKHPNARIPEQKVRSSNKQTIFFASSFGMTRTTKTVLLFCVHFSPPYLRAIWKEQVDVMGVNYLLQIINAL